MKSELIMWFFRRQNIARTAKVWPYNSPDRSVESTAEDESGTANCSSVFDTEYVNSAHEQLQKASAQAQLQTQVGREFEFSFTHTTKGRGKIEKRNHWIVRLSGEYYLECIKINDKVAVFRRLR